MKLRKLCKKFRIDTNFNSMSQDKLISIVAFVMLSLIIYSNTNYLFAQEKSFNLIRFGIKSFGGVADTNYLNSITNDWLKMVVDASNAELENEPITLPFNIEYGYQPFIIIQPLSFLQLGIKMDYAYSNSTGKFENPLTQQNYKLNFKSKSYIPGIFTNLLLSQFEFGCGIFYSYTNIDVNDNFFGYKNTWYGENTGYELHFGISSSAKNRFGYTISVKYRDLLINDLKDDLNRIITYTDTQKNLSLNMSGFILEVGLYFQFIKMGKK